MIQYTEEVSNHPFRIDGTWSMMQCTEEAVLPHYPFRFCGTKGLIYQVYSGLLK